MSCSDIDISIMSCDKLSLSQINLLINLTGRVFLGEESLKGKYYFDSNPSYVCITKRNALIEEIEKVASIHLGIETF